jgi:hypothetical protein
LRRTLVRSEFLSTAHPDLPGGKATNTQPLLAQLVLLLSKIHLFVDRRGSAPTEPWLNDDSSTIITFEASSFIAPTFKLGITMFIATGFSQIHQQQCG